MNEEGIKNRIRQLLKEIQTEVDPVLLNRCRSIFRREVSFFNRSYMAAYLLLLAEDGPGAKKAAGSSARSGRDFDKNARSPKHRAAEKPDQQGFRIFARPGREGEDRKRPREQRSEAPRFLSEEESVRLFISVGRNRKVFPREILALINAKSSVAREDIGTIRILDNYSFVQVRTPVADAVINALNGQNFRGRTLTVNYARSRREGEEETAETETAGNYPEAPENTPVSDGRASEAGEDSPPENDG